MYKFVQGMAVVFASLCTTGASAAPNATADAATTSISAARHAPPGAAAVSEARVAKYAARGGDLESLLVREDEGASGQRLTGVTRLGDGTRLWEEARFDHAGKLVRAESLCSCPSGSSEAIVFEPNTGSVEVRTASNSRRWSVPTDHPWIWVPRGCGSSVQQRSLATPVSALVAMRAATHSTARRLIDTQRFSSHAIMLDQVVVPEASGSVWVVLGDDAVLIRDGLPQRWRANALGVDVEQR